MNTFNGLILKRKFLNEKIQIIVQNQAEAKAMLNALIRIYNFLTEQLHNTF